MFAQAALIVLGLVLFNNYRAGTLGDWFKAKFLNVGGGAGPATPSSSGRSGLFGSGAKAGGGAGGGGGGSWGATNASLTGTGALPNAGVRTGVGAGDGALMAPVTNGVLTGRFGDPRVGHRHLGVDWAVPTGTPVRAARAGRITYAGSSTGYGLRVDVDHGGGLVTRYAHLSRINARLGQEVAAGAVIAASGNTGESTGPHLHFEVRRNGVAVDPLPSIVIGLPGGVAA